MNVTESKPTKVERGRVFVNGTWLKLIQNPNRYSGCERCAVFTKKWYHPSRGCHGWRFWCCDKQFLTGNDNGLKERGIWIEEHTNDEHATVDTNNGGDASRGQSIGYAF